MAEKNNAKRIEDLTFGDEYLFEEVMKNKELCKLFIETFLEIPDIVDIEYVGAEESYKSSFWSKGVRFDIYIKGQDGVAYVVELQRADTKEIDKRLRYYQSKADVKQFPKGRHSTYKDLKDSYIVFIARKDLYGKGRYRYSFQTICKEEPDLTLDDGAYKIVFNTQGTHGEVSEDVKAFLNAIEGMKTNNPFVQKFEAFAEEVKADETWRASYMQTELIIQDKIDAGIERGIAQGIEQGIEQGANEKAVEMAKKMLLDDLPLETVSTYTELPMDELVRIQARMVHLK